MLSGKFGVNVLLGEKVAGKDYEKIAWSLNESKNQINSYEKNTQINLISYILKNPAHFMKRYIIPGIGEALRKYIIPIILVALLIVVLSKVNIGDKSILEFIMEIIRNT